MSNFKGVGTVYFSNRPIATGEVYDDQFILFDPAAGRDWDNFLLIGQRGKFFPIGVRLNNESTISNFRIKFTTPVDDFYAGDQRLVIIGYEVDPTSVPS